MDELKMYIKDKAPLAVFYNFMFMVAIFVIWVNIIDFTSGEVTRNIIKSFMMIPILPFSGWYFWSLAKKVILVMLDYKKQELVTETLKLRGGGYRACDSQKHGAYLVLEFCGKKGNFWMYDNNQVYVNVVPQEMYKVVYYKHSNCIKFIERITFNRKDIKHKKKQKSSKRPANIEQFQVFFHNYIDGFIVDLFVLITIPFCFSLLKYIFKMCVSNGDFDLFYMSIAFFVVFYFCFLRVVIKRMLSFVFYKINKTTNETVTIIGVPRTKKFLDKQKPNEFILYTINSNDRKRTMKFYSTDILGLGDLEERSGYLGFGNFIGTKYEVEYYKVSRVIKSMKLISHPGQSDQSEDG